jgi:hypothetical protein
MGISWTDHVRNEEVFLRAKEQGNTLHEIRKEKANWIGHIFRRNCHLQQVIKGKIKGEIEEKEIRGRRHRKLLDEERILTSEGERSRSRYVESSLWKSLWTYRETNY